MHTRLQECIDIRVLQCLNFCHTFELQLISSAKFTLAFHTHTWSGARAQVSFHNEFTKCDVPSHENY